MHIKIQLSYDGSKFNGFQIQNNLQKVKTVAGELTKAFKQINIHTKLVGSGRTDTGVHATSQVISCDIPSFWNDLKRLKKELNRIIKPHIYIKNIEVVKNKFHARFSAKKRLYRYVLYSGNYQPFLSNYALHVEYINTQKLDSILKQFVGIHDFKNFKKLGSQTPSDVREIFKAGAYNYDKFTIIYFLGNSFLRSQVRMMCNFALETMKGNLTYWHLTEQLSCTAKHSTGVIPPNGLYLAKIFY